MPELQSINSTALARKLRDLRAGDQFTREQTSLFFQPVEKLYDRWPTPTCIVADGPYGVSGFPGDLPTAATLADWYAPHVAAWSRHATPQTTLWFWNTELGWANVHPVLERYGWEYRSCHVWNKGIGHAAGNSNTETLRKFPVVTEVCVQYVRRAEFEIDGQIATMQAWLRHEWIRSGLPMYRANQACGVKNAATRKYLTADHLWYYPPPDAFAAMAAYVNAHGRPSGRPYFSMDGRVPMSDGEWAKLRAKFTCAVGITNVWNHPQVAGTERINGSRSSMQWKYRSLHGSQKPLKLIDLIITASTDENDVVWEPFGGLCPTAICSLQRRRRSFSAEIVREFFSAAVERLKAACR
jgi:site-specific DNA-methyltransferase (adenine-specific)